MDISEQKLQGTFSDEIRHANKHTNFLMSPLNNSIQESPQTLICS